jgi:hypothetical protein
MRQTPTTILRDRSFQLVRVQLGASELIFCADLKPPSFSPSRRLTRRFLSSHRLVPWTHFHHNLDDSDLSDCFPPSSQQDPILRLCCFYSRLRYHISHLVNTENQDSSTTRHCQLSLWYLVSGKTCPIKRRDANNITLAPIPAESPAPPTSYHQSGTRALSQRLRYRRHHDPRGLGGSWQAASIKHPPQSVVHWARRLFSDPQIGGYPFTLGEHRSSFERFALVPGLPPLLNPATQQISPWSTR